MNKNKIREERNNKKQGFGISLGITLLFLSSVASIDQASIKYPFALGFLYFIIISLFLMIIPFIYYKTENDLLPYKLGNTICTINSVTWFIISFVLQLFLGMGFIGGLGAIIYYYVNMYLFVKEKSSIQEPKTIQTKKNKQMIYNLDELILNMKDQYSKYMIINKRFKKEKSNTQELRNYLETLGEIDKSLEITKNNLNKSKLEDEKSNDFKKYLKLFRDIVSKEIEITSKVLEKENGYFQDYSTDNYINDLENIKKMNKELKIYIEGQHPNNKEKEIINKSEKIIEEFICDNCGGGVRANDSKCPHCGLEFEEAVVNNTNKDHINTSKLEEFVCDNCGCVVKDNDLKCPHCGESFEHEEELPIKENKSDMDQKYSDLYKLKELLDNNIITKEEFDKEKKKILK